MNAKLLILVIALIQGLRAETIQEVINDLTPKIISLKANIDTVIQNGGQLVRQTHATIGQTITDGETTIQDQLDQVDDIVAQAEQEAQQKGVDVNNCVSGVSEAVGLVDFQKIHNCADDQNLNLIGTELGNLRIIKRNLSSAINRCVAANLQNVPGLRNCIQSDIDSAGLQIEEIQAKINKICEEAPQKASLCVENAVTELDKIITSAAHDLKECLQKVL